MIKEEEIKQYLIDFQDKKIKAFDRELNIKPTKEFISSIVGARRVGKTFLLFNLISKIKNRKEVLYVDFDYPEFLDFNGADLPELVNLHLQLFGQLKYIFFDEIQNIKDWERGLKKIYEGKKYYIFITGSSAQLLSRELASRLRGRTLSYNLFPLSFREFLAIKNIKPPSKEKYLPSERKNKIIFAFNKYLRLGGYPQIILEERLKEAIIKDYKDLVLFRDLVERYNLKNLYVVKHFFEYLISSFAKEISIDKFYNFLKSQNIALSKKTLYNYLEYFSSSMFFHFLRSFNVRQSLRKVYLNDTIFGSGAKGRNLENLVFVDLLRRRNKDIFYFSHERKFECDFVILKDMAIQVVWELNEDNKKRELKGLVEAIKYFKLKKAVVLTYNQEGTITINKVKIKIMPVWQWLLSFN